MSKEDDFERLFYEAAEKVERSGDLTKAGNISHDEIAELVDIKFDDTFVLGFEPTLREFKSELTAELSRRAGAAKLNSPMRVETAPEGEDIARENWNKDEQETPPHALGGIQGEGGTGGRSRRQDAGRAGAAA